MTRPVMTLGVAPGASKACTLRMDESEPTTLSEFDSSDGIDDEERDDAPTPESNASDIQHLIDIVETLTDKVGDVAAQLEQRDDAQSIDTEPDDNLRMFN